MQEINNSISQIEEVIQKQKNPILKQTLNELKSNLETIDNWKKETKLLDFDLVKDDDKLTNIYNKLAYLEWALEEYFKLEDEMQEKLEILIKREKEDIEKVMYSAIVISGKIWELLEKVKNQKPKALTSYWLSFLESMKSI